MKQLDLEFQHVMCYSVRERLEQYPAIMFGTPMPRTKTEQRIIQQRKLQERGGLIVPLIEEILKQPIGVDTPEDAEWLYGLVLKQVEREKIRQASYSNDEMVFSPSGLADCMRRVYLSKNHKKLGLERVSLPAIEPHFYFLTGDFLHLKWQFVFYKLSCIDIPFHLVDCEIPILSKRKDHGGTLDVLLLLGTEALIVDVKGLNVRSFNSVDRDEHTDWNHKYRIQLTDYGMLFNSALQRGTWVPDEETRNYMEFYGMKEFPKVKRMVLLAENKGGPDMSHPAALTENIIDLKSNLPEVRARLEKLREYDEKEEVPPAECESTRLISFTGCPFAEFCRTEVQKAEAKRAKAKASKPLRVARPARNRGSR